MKKIAIFASGEGTNAENIINYFNRPSGDAIVDVVITNRPSAPVIARASRLGVKCVVISRDEINDGSTLASLLVSRGIDIIVLAGFMLMMPPDVITRYRGNIVNIHPALLPKFGGKGMYGNHVHEAVVEARENITGITIHHVNELYDDGAIIFQASVPVAPDDTPAAVAAKVRELELIHYARIIDLVLVKG